MANSNLTRRRFLKGTLAAAVAATLKQVPTVRAQDRLRRPNIILLLTDDQRADSLSCAGNTVLQTPNIDALASAGVRFENHFATSAVCMSSRASILTGLHTQCHGIVDFSRPLARPLFDRSYPILLRKAGYRTGFVGKWGLGGDLPKDDYDYFAGYSGQGFYFEPGRTKHLTVVQAEQAVEFLRGCGKDQPFCLAVSFKAPHPQDEGRTLPGIYPKYPYDRAMDPLFVAQTVPLCKTVDAAPRPAFFEETLNCTREAPDFGPANYQETMKDIYRLLTGVDQAVGSISAALRNLGLDDNTIIIYSSDHGSFFGEHGFGGKWLMHEESIRSPLIIRDPHLPAPLRGGRRAEISLNVDLAPTMLEMADLPIPLEMQGRSLLSILQGAQPAWRSEWYYENLFRAEKSARIAASQGIRTVDWKYIRYIDEKPIYEQLFDLKNDPREEKNLAGAPEQGGTLAGLRGRLLAWQDGLQKSIAGTRWADPA